jgi:hypothetical protein
MKKSASRSYAASMTRRAPARRRARRAPRQQRSNAFLVAMAATVVSLIALAGVVMSVMAGG